MYKRRAHYIRNSKEGDATCRKKREGEERAAAAYLTVQRQLALPGDRNVKHRKRD